MLQMVLIGAGQRGMIYAKYAYESGLVNISAIAEPNPARRAAAAEAFHVAPKYTFETAQTLFAAGRLGDAAIIATMDRAHYAQAMTALEQGYDIILEKPISPDALECLRIERKAKETGRCVVVCHVLRYSPFFQEIKRIVDSGELGAIVTIQHNENIGNFHMAHSFVRGNWRSSTLSSPIIMQKSCHDMDLLVWLTSSRCKRLSSFGSLAYFNAKHAPDGAAARCHDCPYRDTCRFSAYVCYPPVLGNWPATALCVEQTKEALQKAIDEGPYGRCVFHCDNDVCDNMVTNLEFENGVTATFNLSAFTNRMARTMKIMCENGEIRASEADNRIEVIPFAATGVARVDERIVIPVQPVGAHGGGDVGLVNDFLSLLKHEETHAVSDISCSVESHFMACAVEESRLSHQVVDMDEFRARLEAEVRK